MYSGILSESVPDVPISCATGDCTWPIIPTLGICGACMNMVDRLRVLPCSGSQGSEGYCNFSIPGGMTLSKPRTLMEWNQTTPVFIAGPGSDYIFNQTDVVGEGYIKDGLSFNFIGQAYSQFMYTNRGMYSPGNETTFGQANVLAYECGLWYCLQARSVNSSNGIVEDVLINHRNSASQEVDGDLLPGDESTLRPYNFQDDPTFNVDNVSNYMVGVGSMAHLRHNLFGALTGSITINAEDDVDYRGGDIPGENILSTRDGLGSAADCLHAAWTYVEDIDKWWARLAKSMTNNVRMNGFINADGNDRYASGISWTDADEDGRYAGTAWASVVFIHVKWLWLIFPAALVSLSTTFLVATMVASWHSNLRPWKSFILPVLYTRLEDGLQEEWMQEYARENTLLNEVNDRWVGLDDCEHSLVFRHVVKESKRAPQIRFAGDTSMDG